MDIFSIIWVFPVFVVNQNATLKIHWTLILQIMSKSISDRKEIYIPECDKYYWENNGLFSNQTEMFITVLLLVLVKSR